MGTGPGRRGSGSPRCSEQNKAGVPQLLVDLEELLCHGGSLLAVG